MLKISNWRMKEMGGHPATLSHNNCCSNDFGNADRESGIRPLSLRQAQAQAVEAEIKPLVVVSWALICPWSQWEQLRHFMGSRLKMISVSWCVSLPYLTAAAGSPPKSTRHWLPPFTLAPCLYSASDFELCVLSSYFRVTELRSQSWVPNPQATVLPSISLFAFLSWVIIYHYHEKYSVYTLLQFYAPDISPFW